jgi:hypothetical protein
MNNQASKLQKAGVLTGAATDFETITEEPHLNEQGFCFNKVWSRNFW